MMRRLSVTVVGAVLVTLAGCAQPVGPGSAPPAAADYEDGPYGQACDAADPFPDDAPPTEPLTAGATLARATRCVFESELVPGDGEWMVRIDQEATSGLDRLADALRQPSEPAPINAVCPAIAYAPIVITVTEDSGRQFHPTIPTTACGAPLRVVSDAIVALPWATVATMRVSQTRSELEVTSGCSSLYKPMIDITAADGPRGDAPTAILVNTPPEMRVCRYEVGAHPDHPGEPLGMLTSASTLGPDAIRDLFAAVNMAPWASGPCDAGSPFATVHPVDAAPWLTIELDGCFRVLLDADGTLRRLDPDLVTRLLA